MPRGDEVCYRSVSGEIYDAILAAEVSPAGFVAVEIALPSIRESVKFSRAKWRPEKTDEVTACWPRGK